MKAYSYLRLLKLARRALYVIGLVRLSNSRFLTKCSEEVLQRLVDEEDVDKALLERFLKSQENSRRPAPKSELLRIEETDGSFEDYSARVRLAMLQSYDKEKEQNVSYRLDCLLMLASTNSDMKELQKLS